MTISDSPFPNPGLTAFIGGGNMARSLIAGLRRQRVSADRIVVAEPQDALRQGLQAEFGVRVCAEGRDAVGGASIVVLAVKPQVMQAVCEGLRGALGDAVVVSVAAGLPCARLSEWLGTPRIVRAMPNTPALLGAGATGLFAPPEVDAAARAKAEAVMAGAGLTRWIEDETLMDVVTALSGSGPAYFFLLVESLVAAAVAQGLPRETAEALARQTALGAARMLTESGDPAEELRRRVTSPGGTTQAAIECFEAGGFETLIAAAVDAAVKRGRALAAG
ncbi:pyrroline-5-carboxylate reductase [Aquimonas voraii]|uniref:Pyrroline-5-carboxylate reductase n=1 Tax=Aquimonas voraii TaxID=265719 RepID=A0A1G6YUW6_9GAMM|nr:pyrroline-5-carboxylate reductase [Aquimonas voraii]SDD94128.1 pyrroline-5-carboxylate reductase [Aquimonas voraii]